MPPSRISDSNGILSISLAAKFANVSQPTMRNWIDAGRIKGAYKLDGSGERRIPAPALVNFLSSRSMPICPQLLQLAATYQLYYGTTQAAS